MSTASANSDAPVGKDDLVLLHYDLWAESGGRTELIDTTHEEVAQEANYPKPEGQAYGPRPHLIGGEYFPAGIEEALAGVKVAEPIEREFSPAEAFGERDPKLIELFSMHEVERLPEMRREDAHLDVGTILNIRGRRGRVVSLTAARVRVDFNPPFSGRKVRGKFEVVGRIMEPAEQVKAIVEMNYGRSKEFHVELHGEAVTLKIPDRSKFDIAWMAAKPRIIDRIRTRLKPKSIRVVEEYVTPVPAGAKAATPKDSKEPATSAEPDAPAKPAHRAKTAEERTD